MVILPAVPARLRGRGVQTVLGCALLATVIGQLIVLYLPQPPDGLPLFPFADKVIHLGIFAAPTMLAVLLGRGRVVIPVLAVHAPLSELVQGLFLPERGMDPLDAVADLCGVALGWWVGNLVVRWLARS